MPVNPEIRDSAYQFFIEEVPELLQVIETGLLNLKEERTIALVHDLMRSAHSLKGGAASVELDGIKLIAHRLEDTFKALYSDTVEIDAELENLLLEAYDVLSFPLMEQLNTGGFDPVTAQEKADEVFARLEEKLGDALIQGENYLPSSEDLGVDIVASMFEIDVAQELERLAEVIANPSEFEVEGELRAQLDVFAGFSDILNLPGLGEIAATTLKALEANPNRALEITQLVLVDFQAAREAVLKGDRAVGGKPSEALIALTQGISSTSVETSTLESNSLDDVFGDFVESIDIESNVSDEVFEDELETSPPPLNLDAALESLNANFEDLPESTTLLEPKSPSKQASQKQKKKAAAQQSIIPHLSIRVDVDRLERMNNLIGELTINRNGLSLQNEQLQRSLRELLYRFTNFQDLASNLQTLSDVILVAPKAKQVNSEFKASSLIESNLSRKEGLESETEFDALEMDRYNKLHYLLQGILEEMLQLEEKVDDLTLFAGQSNQTIEQQRSMLNHLRDELMWSRMLPIGDVLSRFPRLIHNFSTKFNKPVELELIGTGVLVDKAALEKLYDPLLHLLRNAFDHGIESPQIRHQQQKSKQGKIVVRAYHSGNQTVIEVKDDGQGLNLEKISRKAIEKGLISSAQAEQMSEERLSELIFEPGFSTTQKVTEISGRGVGLDSVRASLRSLKGKVQVTSIKGKGSVFTLRLPLTLTIAKLLVCLEGTSAIALPSDSIEEIIVPKQTQIKKSGEQRFLDWQGQLVPIYRAKRLLEYGCPLPETIPGKALVTIPTPSHWALPLLILRRDYQFFALEVERVVTEQELVIKPFGKVISPPAYTYGCTILGDGSIIPVIDGLTLIEQAFGESANSAIKEIKPPKAAPKNKTVPTILAIDDSTALRRTLALSLQKSGYKVLQAKDGQEALEKLSQSPVHLIVCDLEMPNMNGFEFLNHHRQDPKLSKIPVVMLTSRSNDKHRKLATHLGATAYFSKPYIEQEFLPALKHILHQRYTKKKAVST